MSIFTKISRKKLFQEGILDDFPYLTAADIQACLRRPGALFIKTAPVREASAKIFYCWFLFSEVYFFSKNW
jgi:hypothetical protein